MMNKLSPLLFLAVFLVGSPVGCMAANLRAKRSKSASSKDAVTVNDNDVVGASSYLVFEVEGYNMDDLENMSPKKQAIMDCAFHKAFDQVHGDHDGLYLSGQQIVATDKAVEDDDAPGVVVGDTVGEVDLRRDRPYVYRPRRFPSKPRPRPTYPPPLPPPRQHPIIEKWHIYWHFDMSGMCRMCPDDDSMEISSHSLLLNTNTDENFARRASKKNRNQGIASDFVASEASVNAIADAVRTILIEGSCDIKGDNEDSFEFVQDTDIFVLSQSEFEESVAAIAAFREARDSAQAASVATTDMEASPASTELMPFHYGGSSSSSIVATATTNGLFKIGLSGVDCGAWNSEALLDMNSGLHDSINSMGFTDKGHVIDKIVGGRNQSNSDRRYVWKCHYDVYAKLDLAGSVLDAASLDDIGDALCDDLIQYGGNAKFQNVIDCQLEPLTANNYRAIVTADEKVGLTVSSALE